MMNKILIAAASAGMLAVGSFAVPAPAAAATSVSVSIRTPHFSLSIGHRPAVVYPKPHRVCKPVYKRVYYKVRSKTYSKLVRTGTHCYWVYPRPTPIYHPYPYYW
jgi:hypothetical protein